MKQTFKKNIANRLRNVHIIVAIFFVVSVLLVPFVNADRFEQEITELKQDNAQSRSLVDQLTEEAKSLEDAINKMQAQIDALQAQIAANKNKSAELKVKIAEAEIELAHQKDVLGQNIKAMYLEGQISTLEMLATSKDLSQFVDKQQYRDVVKSKIKGQVDAITALRLELQAQKEEVERLIKEDNQLKTEIGKQQTERNRLLNLNQTEQNDFNQKIAQNNERIKDLRQQQALENIRLFGGGDGVIGGGGYPWGGAPCLSTGQVDGWCPGFEWGYNGSWNNWSTGGYAYRNCTDWVAWRTGASGGLGNAKLWDDRAPSYGYAVTNTPTKGAAAVSNSGYYGHVMYVESVNGDGTITISDYNRAGTGKYSVATINPSGLVFVIIPH